MPESEIGKPFWSGEFCLTCKIALDLPSYANGRCDRCGNKPEGRWVVRRFRTARLELCTPAEIAKAKEDLGDRF